MNSSSNKMDSTHTGMWVSFFTAAGIPSDVAATYALTFTENRIQNDMLLDLNKEYLRDMGITRMGDVIAILRHAKQVHESTARERVLSSASGAGGPGSRVPVAAVVARATVAQAKPSSPASRILERYTRNATAQEALPSTTKRKLILADPGAESSVDAKKIRLIRFGVPSQQPTPEGPLSKQTVFSRLGNSDPPKPEANNTPKTIFARLGAKAEKKADDNEMPIEGALKYEGILKSTATIKKIVTVTTTKNNTRKIAMGCTMRADETPISIKEKLALPKTKSVKFSNQVEYKEIEPSLPGKVVKVPAKAKFTPVFNKPERRLSMPEGVVNSVKARLGTKNANNLTITRNIFNRLGV